MAKQRGRAVRWSTGGITFTAGIVSSTNAALAQRWGLKLTAQKTKIKDEAGSTLTVVYSDPENQFSIDVIPVALSGTNTEANAQASVDGYGLEPGAVITAVDSKGTVIDAKHSGKFVLDDAEIVGELEGAVVVRLNLYQSIDNDVSPIPA